MDYAFLYELDGNKIYCNRPNPMSETGLCEGEICYDDGFNHLYCSKCGARYKAIELQKKINDNEIIVKREGEAKMKIKVSGGSTKANKIIDNGVANENFRPTSNSIIRSNKSESNNVAPTRKVKVNIAPKVEAPKRPTVNVNVSKPATKPEVVDEEIKTVNGVSVEPAKEEKSMSMEEFVSSIVPEVAPEVKAKDAFVSVNEVIEAIEVPAKSPVEIIDDAVNTIIENLQAIKIDVVKEDAVNRMIDKIVKNIPANGAAFKNVIEIAMSIYDNADDDAYLDIIHSAKFVKLIDRAFEPVVKITNFNPEVGIADYELDMAYAYDDEHNDVAFTLVGTAMFDVDRIDDDEAEEIITEDVVEEPVDSEQPNGYSGMQFYNAVVVEANSIFPDAEKQEIIVGIDENGDYVVNADNNIIAYNIINDCEIDSLALVSKEWVQSVDAILSESEEPEEEIPAENQEE